MTDEILNFKVPYTKILEILPHPNAERLEYAKIYDFMVIVQKDKYKVDDLVFYVPIDSILSSNLESILFPKDSKIKLYKSRIKQIKIRGCHSQGMIINLNDAKEFIGNDPVEEENYAEQLGISKYEPPAPTYQPTSSGPKLRNKPFENPYFRKFNGIPNIKWAPYAFKDEEVILQEKVHGCIRNYEEIELVDGTKKTIQEIVDNKLEVEVWGYDEINKKIVPSKILNWANHGPTKDWLKISYTKIGTSRGPYFRTLEVTPNHKFYIPEIGEYIAAEYIKPGTKVLFKQDDYGLNCDEAEKMFLLIAPYIASCMKYKLSERYRDFPFVQLPTYVNKYKSKTVLQTILSVEKIPERTASGPSMASANKRNADKYDIETETGNFFINGVLVHNSHIRLGKAPFVTNTFFKKIKKFFGLAPKYECVYGSNNCELTNRSNYTGFYGSDIYGKCIEKLKLFDKIKDGEFIHAELIGPGIQKGYDYGHKEHHIVMFDVRVIQPDGTQKWLNPEDAEAFAKERGIDFVPILYRGVFNKEILEQCTRGPSVYCPKEIREGCVIKSRYKYDVDQNKQAMKSINPDYLDTDPTDNH